MSHFNNYQDAYDLGIKNPQEFWKKQAENIAWFNKPTQILSENNEGLQEWFADGTLNTSYLCIDKHIEDGFGEQTAIIYDSAVRGMVEKYTFNQVKEQVEKLAGGLQSLGVQKGDTVVIYFPMIPQAVFSMLACARIGAIHSVVFGGFAPHELAVRIDDAKPKVIITATSGIEYDRLIAYKPLVDEAIKLAEHKIEKLVIFNRNLGAERTEMPYDVDYAELVTNAQSASYVAVNANHPLYILYTSGTTGKPKGVVRDNGGHAVALKYSMKNIYDMNEGEVFWAASDVGWVVGHSYIVYAPLINRNTTVLFEGKPIKTPDAGTFWRVIQDHKVKVFFTAPTAIRAIKKEDPDGLLLKKYDLSSLKYQFLAGERCDVSTLKWLENQLKVPVIDHWWQTESGYPMLANTAGIELFDVKAGSAGKTVPGFNIQILREDGTQAEPNEEGYVTVKLPLPPGVLMNIWGNTERFKAGYLERFSGYYFSGDGGFVDKEGYIFITGRVDDVINVAGHRLSTAEMEEIVSSHHEVAECCVVGIEEELKGQIPFALVVPKIGSDDDSFKLQTELIQLVREKIGAVAAFKDVITVKRLPKTRSGKILRRTVRDILDGKKYTIPSTIDDPEIIDELILHFKEEKAGIFGKRKISVESLKTLAGKYYDINTLPKYFDVYRISEQDPEEFWSVVAENNFQWKKKWDKVLESDFTKAETKWFINGKLNITENCIDRHLELRGDKVALLFEPNNPNEPSEKITYKQLHERVGKFANMLKANGAKKGDRICIYMPMIPDLAIAVLACARIGAVHSVVFAGFSSSALATRIDDSKCSIVLTTDGSFRGDKSIDLKSIVDGALEKCDSVHTVLVGKRTNSEINMVSGRDKWMTEELAKVNADCPAEEMDAEDMLFILYTSGSTGKPKGMVHTCGGYMVYTAFTFKNIFQYKENDVYWCTADIGWITGHSYIVYGPLLNGATTVIFEGVPSYPDFGRFWEVVDKHQVNQLYTAPTAIRALAKESLDYVNKYDLGSLRILGSVGEPINEEAWHWYNDHIGKKRCPIVDTWWQTETGGIMISPIPYVTPTKPTYATLPLPGIHPVLLDDKGNEIEGNPAEGNLCIKHPWPSIARTIYGDHQRFKETYFTAFPGYYFTGDGALRDEVGYNRITGRVDDVIIVSGHNLGTAPIEDSINEHPAVAESAIVGFPHDIKGNALYGFVILKEEGESRDHNNLRKEINQLISNHIGPIAKLDKIQFVSGLPKTRSGKIMRRILRKIAEGDTSNLGDISTLLNPEVVEEIKNNAM